MSVGMNNVETRGNPWARRCRLSGSAYEIPSEVPEARMRRAVDPARRSIGSDDARAFVWHFLIKQQLAGRFQ